MAFAALVLGVALAFVVLAAEAFLGAALAVAGFASVFLGRPAVLVPAGFAALVAFWERGQMRRFPYESVGSR